MNKFLEKLRKFSIIYKDMLTYLGLDYRDASLLTLDFVVLGISIPMRCTDERTDLDYRKASPNVLKNKSI